jgi:ISXO2-like transposase domain
LPECSSAAARCAPWSWPTRGGPPSRPGFVEHVEQGAAIYSDALQSYIGLAGEYDHKVVDHAEKYVDGQVHVNGVENFWSLLKRGLHGTYVSVQPWDLFRYIDERVFTYNERDLTDLDRFLVVLGTVAGRRLTHKALRGPRITSLSDCCCGGMPGQ